MGIKIPEFYSLTPREFNNYLIGYQRKAEEDLKTKMILNRDLEFAFISPYLDKKHNIKSAKDYKTFAWEVENPELEAGRKLKTKEEIAAIWQKVDAGKEQ